VALISDGVCGVAVLVDGRQMAWVSLKPSGSPEVIASGELPDGCVDRPCAFEGQFAKGHRLVFASQAAADSEAPETVFAGWVLGSSIVFLELWSGAHAEIDGTRAGPAWGLEPQDCGGELGFFAMPRLQGAEGEAPPVPLASHQGLPRRDAEGEWSFETAAAACSELGLDLP
jgi:hypothetical protein